MSDAPADKGTGLAGSLRRLLDTLLELGQVRLELLGTEVEEQKQRALAALAWSGVGLVLLGAGLVVLAAGVIVVLWDIARWTAFGILLAAYLGGGALALRHARTRLRGPTDAFATSAAELARDRQALGRAPDDARKADP